ncbi:MAG: nickel-dependent hydrogenase large subunit [Betaproteobacteria bacterium]|nr:nickel-dependent hydrogenase large subunit [Betaproteobacteria bacterium]
MRLTVGPFNRVEGDLEVSLELAEGRVAEAWVASPLYRGFEQILRGKDPFDALVFVPRICGICSVSQSAAAAAALRAAMGLAVPPNGARAANLLLACENLADHLTHFYLFFMPDFARAAYAGRPWFERAAARFRAAVGAAPPRLPGGERGAAAAQMLPARAVFMRLAGLLGGKWPHTLSLQPGGSARAVTAAEKLRIHALLREFRAWLEASLFGDTLEAFAALDGSAALWAWADERRGGDLRLFLEIARDLELERLGRAGGLFMSVGAYAAGCDGGARGGRAPPGGGHLFAPGVWSAADGAVRPFDPADVTEDISHAWLDGPSSPAPPFDGHTLPAARKEGAYTWCKAPRWQGRVVECGALARQAVAGHPLARDLVAGGAGSVLARVVARLLEIARVLPEMERWARALVPGEPFCSHGAMPDEARGVGLVEAARGALGHWLVVRDGRIANYQVVAPTTWNFSPRDAAGTAGALEQALAGTPAAGAGAPAVQHVVRSFDPCMVCTVH